jgi:hypothetical protein
LAQSYKNGRLTTLAMTQTTATGGNDWAVIEFLTSPNCFKPFENVTVLNGRALYKFKAKPWTIKLNIFDANELIIGSISVKNIKIRHFIKLPVYLTGVLNVSHR